MICFFNNKVIHLRLTYTQNTIRLSIFIMIFKFVIFIMFINNNNNKFHKKIQQKKINIHQYVRISKIMLKFFLNLLYT